MYSSEQILLILGTSFIFTFKTQSKYDLADESLGAVSLLKGRSIDLTTERVIEYKLCYDFLSQF